MDEWVTKWIFGIIASLFAFGISLVVNQLLKRLEKIEKQIESFHVVIKDGDQLLKTDFLGQITRSDEEINHRISTNEQQIRELEVIMRNMTQGIKKDLDNKLTKNECHNQVEKCDKHFTDGTKCFEDIRKQMTLLNQSVAKGFYGMSLGLLSLSETMLAMAKEHPGVDVKKIEILQEHLTHDMHEQMSFRTLK